MIDQKELRKLKEKYSFQDVPKWELEALEPVAVEEAPKRRGRPPKAVEAGGNDDNG